MFSFLNGKDRNVLNGKERGAQPCKKLSGLHHTTESGSAVCFKVQSLALQCASHCRVSNLSSVCNLYWSNISAKSKPNSKILWPVYQGPDGSKLWKNGGRKSRDTLPLKINCYFFLCQQTPKRLFVWPMHNTVHILGVPVYTKCNVLLRGIAITDGKIQFSANQGNEKVLFLLEQRKEKRKMGNMNYYATFLTYLNN